MCGLGPARQAMAGTEGIHLGRGGEFSCKGQRIMRRPIKARQKRFREPHRDIADLRQIDCIGTDIGLIIGVTKAHEHRLDRRDSGGVGGGQSLFHLRIGQRPSADRKFQPIVKDVWHEPAIAQVQCGLGDGLRGLLGLGDQVCGVLMLPAGDQPIQQRLAIREMPIKTGA